MKFGQIWSIHSETVKPSPDRSAIVRLHKAGRPPATIAKHLGIHRSVVYCPVQRYRDLGGLQDRRRSGRPRTARTPKVVAADRKQIASNATRSISTMARDMGISRNSMERVAHEDLKMFGVRPQGQGRPSAVQERTPRLHLGRRVAGVVNPLDYNLWSFLESKVCATPHPNLDFLKTALIREWEEIDDALLRPVNDAFPKRLRAVVRAKGGRIEK
ncbi:unnamed protein product [Haemonchus placei]|uniref:Uncharacterized protein n=1 Tax=Haemonchus placei TaxID=6290 RepID=A0A3P7YLE6_HAEPC|nr:unnamed protein product [Haemonchus placei]